MKDFYNENYKMIMKETGETHTQSSQLLGLKEPILFRCLCYPKWFTGPVKSVKIPTAFFTEVGKQDKICKRKISK